MAEVSAAVYFLAALILLVLPLDWFLAALSAAAVHELCHILAVRLSGGRVHRIRIGVFGAEIQAALPGPGRELLAILAGPAGSLFLVTAYRIFPKLALCSLAQGLFNLLPLENLDGGRALRRILEAYCPEKAERILYGLQILLLLLLLAAAFWLSVSVFLRIAAGILLIRLLLRKIPCKPGQIRVQ